MTGRFSDSPALAERLFRTALRAYPARFRSLYARAMCDSFRDRLQSARTRSQRRAVIVHELLDVLRSGARERFVVLLGDNSPRDRLLAMIETAIQDVRYALRTLVKHPGFARLAVLVATLGIGANTVIFTLVDAVLLKPMPYADPAGLVVGWQSRPGDSLFNPSMSKPELVEYRAGTDGFESIAAFGYSSSNITVGGTPVPMWTTYIGSGLLETLGVDVALGRSFAPREHTEGNDRVVLLNGRVWRNRFGGDPEIIGREIELDGEPYRIVGVMPDDFQIPVDTKWSGRTSLIRPLLDPAPSDDRENRLAYFVGRLRDGATLEQAQGQVDIVAGEMVRGYPDIYPQHGGWRMNLVALDDEVSGSVRPAMRMLMAAVGLLLLIACANVANLLLARATQRSHEMAVRRALGAGRGRVVRQLLIESLVLAALAGGAALAVTVFGLDLVMAWVPGNLPRLDEVQLDHRVFIFSGLLTLLTGLGFGLVPALRAGRTEAMETLRAGGRDGELTLGRTGDFLVILEAAVAVVVLIGAGLLVRSFWQLYTTDPGFDVARTIVVGYSLDPAHADESQYESVMQETADALATVPGVDSVGMVSNAPFRTTGGVFRYEAEDRAEDARLVTLLAGPGYFETMSIRVVEGRVVNRADDAASEPIAILNRRAAALLWPGESPLGRQIRMASTAFGDSSLEAPNPWLTIVGVVGNTLHNGVDRDPQAEIYMSLAQARTSGYGAFSWTNTMVRAEGDPAQLVAAIRGDMQARFPGLPIRVFPLRAPFTASLARPRFAAQLMSGFAAAAFLLAVVGIYGVISYSVAQRKLEMGIRLAMGAAGADVVRLVVGRWMLRVGIGTVVGILAAAGLSRFVASQLHEISTIDPVTYLAVAVALGLVAGLAAWVPARRATRIDPVEVIRAG